LDHATDAVTDDDDDRQWGKLQYVISSASGGFPLVSGATVAHNADCFHELVSKLKTAYRPNAHWLMNRATASVVRRLKDEQGRYLWIDGLQAGEPDRLLGYGVTLAEDMPDLASDSFSIAFGDFSSGYLIVDRLGVSVLRDPYTTKGRVKFYARRRVGGGVVDFDSIKLLKFSVN
jgi:HK97 family phage major capsid protein